jgi:SAM-dependent methyltransferase
MIAHAATIALAAFLLFLLQPLIGRYILPLYGGAPAVWTVALLFFQSALLAGYAYAHLLTRMVSPRGQAVVHALLALCGLAFLPVIPAADFAPQGGEPAQEILWLLLRTVGLPFFVLAATSPLLQSWLSGERHDGRVYRLYALSNIGSLLALLAYPFALEPWLGRDAQAWGWSAGYAAFALATLAAALRRALRPAPGRATTEPAAPVGRAARVLWFALAGCGVWMLMAVTNEMTINIAPTPFLWVLPLGLYLFSFVLAFGSERLGTRRFTISALLVSLLLFGAASSGVAQMPIMLRVTLFAVALLLACLALHAELYRLRPAAPGLTGFYLSVAAGGAAGGAFVGVLAPRLFPLYWEYELGQLLCLLALLGALAVDKSSRLHGLRPRWAWVGILLLVLAWVDVHASGMRREARDSIDSRRSFFGVSRVVEAEGVRTLVHGTTNHGEQFLDERRLQPITYFSPGSGVGRVLANGSGPRRVGVVGLGIGTLAAYGREGDVYRFYELDPEVEEIAREHFMFLAECKAEVQVAIGDGRLLLEREADQGFNVLVLDAFSSDAVPVHLLTLEAFAIYRRHLAPGGVIAVNITNHNLELAPVVAAAAGANGWHRVHIETGDDLPNHVLHAEWLVLSDSVRSLPPGELNPQTRELPAWTDDYSNLFRILK